MRAASWEQALRREVRHVARQRAAPAEWAVTALVPRAQEPGSVAAAQPQAVPAAAWASVAAPQPEAGWAAAEVRRQVAAVPVAAAVRLPAEPDEAAARQRAGEVAAPGGAEVPRQEAAAEVRDAGAAPRPAARAGQGARAVRPSAPASAGLPWIRCRAGRLARSPAHPAPHEREGRRVA
jgi:hypothetical protein